MQCWNCGHEFDTLRKPGRSDTCSKCGKYIRCCLNCRFFDRNASKQCKEPQAEYVKNKEGANFCDYFEYGAVSRKTGGILSSEEAKKKFNNLFKD